MENVILIIRASSLGCSLAGSVRVSLSKYFPNSSPFDIVTGDTNSDKDLRSSAGTIRLAK